MNSLLLISGAFFLKEKEMVIPAAIRRVSIINRVRNVIMLKNGCKVNVIFILTQL
jgi:hypothetical protein